MTSPVRPARPTGEEGPPVGRETRQRDGQQWQLGSVDDVQWIPAATTPGLSITSAIPPVFAAYATLRPTAEGRDDAFDSALVGLLVAHSGSQPWWLGYLETGSDEVIFPDAPRVALYARWPTS